MYTVKVANVDEFRKSKDIWNALALQMHHPTIFCTWEWIYTWWEHFGNDYNLLVLFVYKDSELKGILPLASQSTIFKDGGVVGRILYYCGSKELYPDHIDVVSSYEDAEPCLEAIFEFLLSEYKEWDVFSLSHVADGNQIMSWLQHNELQYEFEIKQVSTAPFIVMSGSFEEYLKKFDGKRRYNLRRNKTRLQEQYHIQYIHITDSFEGLKILFDLHEQRAQVKDIESTFKGADIFNFHNSLLKRMEKNGWGWLRFIGNDEKMIAAFYGFSFGKILSYYQMGFDPEWEQYGPGTLILCEVIEEAFSNGYKEFDMLRGSEKYKSMWTKTYRDLININIYNKTIRGYLSKIILHSKESIKRNLKKVLIEDSSGA
jgi:hypothetical protein